MMREIEGLLGVKSKYDEHRRGLISMIAAWAIDHPGEKIDPMTVFPQHVRRMRQTVFADRRKAIATLCQDLSKYLRDGDAAGLPPQRVAELTAATSYLVTKLGYHEAAVRDAASALVRWRFAELVV